VEKFSPLNGRLSSRGDEHLAPTGLQERIGGNFAFPVGRVDEHAVPNVDPGVADLGVGPLLEVESISWLQLLKAS